MFHYKFFKPKESFGWVAVMSLISGLLALALGYVLGGEYISPELTERARFFAVYLFGGALLVVNGLGLGSIASCRTHRVIAGTLLLAGCGLITAGFGYVIYLKLS